MVTTLTIAGYLLSATGLSLVAVCATAGKAKAEPVRLAKFVPSRYDRFYAFGIERQAPQPAAPVVKREAPAAAPSSAATVEKSGDATGAAAPPAVQGEKPTEAVPKSNATL